MVSPPRAARWIMGMPLVTNGVDRYACSSFSLSSFPAVGRIRFTRSPLAHARNDTKYCAGNTAGLVATALVASSNLDLAASIPRGLGTPE